MKKLAALAAVALASCAFAAKPATEGATLGAWTMDMKAAQALAKQENKPLFLCFTGSDWCGWCKLMEKNVFSEPEWDAYAKENLVLVWLDFPQNAALVPEAIAKQNDELAKLYEITGFPTYVLLSPEGKEVGRLGANRQADAESFARQVDGVFALQSAEKYLSAEDYAGYKALLEERDALQAKFEAWQKRLQQEGEAFEKMQGSIAERLDAYTQKAVDAYKAKK